MDANLEKVIEAYNAAQIRLDEIEAEQRENKHYLEIAKANYADAQGALLSDRDPLPGRGHDRPRVMLGSESLTDLLDRLDTISGSRIRTSGSSRRSPATRQRSRGARPSSPRRRRSRSRSSPSGPRTSRRSRRSSRSGSGCLRRSETRSSRSRPRRPRARSGSRKRPSSGSPSSRRARANRPARRTAAGRRPRRPRAEGRQPPPTHGGVVGIAMQYLGTPASGAVPRRPASTARALSCTSSPRSESRCRTTQPCNTARLGRLARRARTGRCRLLQRSWP